MKVLVTAPFVGEIGWELLAWQGRVRWVFERGRFDRLLVLGGEGKDTFYADMPLDYRPIDLFSLPGSPYEDRRWVRGHSEPVSADLIRSQVTPLVNDAIEALRSDRYEVETLWPEYAGTIRPCDDRHQRFVPFHRTPTEPRRAPAVVLVQRNRSFGARNWTDEQWAELRGRLGDRGIQTSVYPCEARGAIELLSDCDLAVGQSTGGLHLASLCGCPHVVWSVDDSRRWTPWEMTNRQRYETMWNPLGTPVHYHSSSQLPLPAEVTGWIMRALASIGRRTGSRASRTTFHCKWRMRDWLVREVVRTPFFTRWPWPIQRFVRYRLV